MTLAELRTELDAILKQFEEERMREPEETLIIDGAHVLVGRADPLRRSDEEDN